MSTPKKRLTLVDVNKKFEKKISLLDQQADMFDRTGKATRKDLNAEILNTREHRTATYQQIKDLEKANDVEFRATGEHLSAIHGRLDDLEKGALENEKVWRRTSHASDTLKEDQMGQEKRLEDLEALPRRRTGGLDSRHTRLIEKRRQEIEEVTRRVRQIERVTPIEGSISAFTELARDIKDIRRVQEKRDNNTVDLITTLQQQIKQLEHSNSERLQENRALEEVVKTLGPLWKTQAGHTVPMALLSTPHLQQLIGGTWVHSVDSRRFIRKELKRREEDRKWREKQGDYSLADSQEDRMRALERLTSKLSRQETGRNVIQGNNASRFTNLERCVKQNERDIYDNVPVGIKVEDAIVEQMRKIISGERAEGGLVGIVHDEVDVYYDAEGDRHTRPKPSVEEVVAGQISDIKDDVKELQLDLNQQHSMIDIYGNRLDKLEDAPRKLPKPKPVEGMPYQDPDHNVEESYVDPDGEFISDKVYPHSCKFKFKLHDKPQADTEDDEDDSYVDKNGDLVLPLIFPKMDEDLSYTITRGRRNGKLFISYGNVKMETPKRSFLSRILPWIKN